MRQAGRYARLAVSLLIMLEECLVTVEDEQLLVWCCAGREVHSGFLVICIYFSDKGKMQFGYSVGKAVNVCVHVDL